MNRLGRPRRLAVAAIAVVIAAFATATALAAAGSLDPTWGGTGYVTTSFPGDYSFANGVAVRADKVVAVGGVANGTGDFAIARYNHDGSPDLSFGSSGEVTTDFNGGSDLATAVAFEGDKIVVAGYTSPVEGTFEFALARYLHNGHLDHTFGSGGKVVSNFSGYDFADALVIVGTRIVVVGETRAGGGGDNFALARYKDDGSLDGAFGTGGFVATDFNGGFDSANGVKLMGTRIVVGGYVQGANFDFGLARYQINGALDSSFGTGGKVETDFGHGDDFGHSVDVRASRIILVGSASNGSNQDFAAAAYGQNGALDHNFNGTGKSTIDMGGDDQAFGGAIGQDNNVVAAGYSPSIDGSFAVARWTKNGLPDPTFGTGGFTTTQIGGASAAFAMTLDQQNRIVVAGYSDNDFAVARYLNK